MRNPRLAGRYAKALMDLAIEKGKLNEVNKSVSTLSGAIGGNRDLQLLLQSPVIKADKKNKIIQALAQKFQTDDITNAFINLIVNKHRENFLDQILNAFGELYKEKNNIMSVQLTVAHEISAEMKSAIEQKIQEQLAGKSIELNISVNPKLIGGFILESNNKMFDASIARDLKDIKEQFLQNLHIPNIR